MATPPEQPWSNRERNYLLAEILKAANPPAEHLYNLIRGLNVQPRWEDIPLPAGRSLNSSRQAFDDLWRSMSSQAMVPPQTPTPLSAPAQSLKRPYSFEGLYSAGGSAREIRPRPPQPINAIYPQPSSEPTAKRKRGRPTKAEQRAKEEAKAAAAAAASGESVAAPMSRPTTQIPASTQIPIMPAPPGGEIKPVTAAAARMPIAAMLTPNPRASKSASNSSSSSGKRRRARSDRSELGGSGGGGGNGYDSPYATMGPGLEDSPARAAVLRHREEPATSVPRIDPPAPPPESSYPHQTNPDPH